MHRMERTHLLLLIILLSVQSCSIAVAAANITTDQSALLALKSQITNDPQNFLTTNWSTSSASNVCTWIGVTCAAGHLRVAALNLSYMDLTGTIPPHIGNLSFLVQMDFKNNSFHGTLPQELRLLRRLELISLRYNNFGGTIPSWFGSLSNLQTFDLYGNQFSGSVPSSIFNLSALQVINLSYNQLSGTIPKEIGNLTMLKALYLDQNDFEEIPTLIGSKDQLERLYVQFNGLKGPVPTHVFNMSSLIVLALNQNNLNGSIPDNLCQYLPSLQWLYLGYNRLDGPLPSKFGEYCKQLQILVLERNNFSGSIPKNIGNLTQLLVMDVQNNNLEGTIPDEIGNLPSLQSLLLSKNNLDGSIPPNVGNLTQLVNFDLAYNNLSGSIPDEIRDLQKLETLSINVNNLNGLIPSTIFNMSSIRVIGLTHNQLSGSLPANIGLRLPYLEGFYVAENYLTGEIPNFVSNGSSKLTKLEMSANSFTGFVPSNLCSLTNLELLSMHSSNLTIDTSTPEANILLCLANLTMLTYIALSDNPLKATLPVSLGSLSASLEYFNLGNCNMRGNIPNDIGNLSSLTSLGLEYNQLDGSIPSSIGRLHNLQGLYLTGNNLQGYIPSELCQLENLYELYLGGNQLSGSIPSCLDNLAPTLRELSLGSNSLTSAIPSTIWQLEYILNLDLSSNLLDGHLTEDIGNLKVVTAINFSDNRLSGSIPTRIGDLQDLVNLSLSNNNLGGSIPSSVGKLLGLEILDLSQNIISGVIPKSLEALLHLTILNFSFNKLQGEIPIGGPFRNFTPQSFLSNAGLCGDSQLHVPPCKNGTGIRPNARKSGTFLLKYIVPPIISAILLVASILIFIKCRKRRIEDATKTTLSPKLSWKRVSRLELERATNAFDESNLLGTGGFGSVYKGTLSNGMIVAVKVFNLQLEGAFRSFDSECQVMANIRHRNLTKIISCCSELDFKALVLQYMPKGSLEKWMYSEDSPLSLLQRLNIMIDVASALEYLHHGHHSTEHIVHCDVKPSNILIDNDMVGHVADFGVAKLLGGGNSMSQTMTLATIGYMAPEYGREGIVTRRGDVYSFGIVLMETFTKRKPTDEMFGGKMNMKQWIADSLFADGALLEVVDADLLVTEEDDNFVTKRDCLASILRLALGCSAQSPEERTNMQDAAMMLNRIKIKFLEDCRELKS